MEAGAAAESEGSEQVKAPGKDEPIRFVIIRPKKCSFSATSPLRFFSILPPAPSDFFLLFWGIQELSREFPGIPIWDF